MNDKHNDPPMIAFAPALAAEVAVVLVILAIAAAQAGAVADFINRFF